MKGVQIECALQKSLRPGRKIWFDEVGRRMEMVRCREGNVRVVGRRGRGEEGRRGRGEEGKENSELCCIAETF